MNTLACQNIKAHIRAEKEVWIMNEAFKTLLDEQRTCRTGHRRDRTRSGSLVGWPRSTRAGGVIGGARIPGAAAQRSKTTVLAEPVDRFA